MFPAVSVIVPTYNRWPILQEAIDSVLAQTFRDFELIVVDDGSSDETWAQVRALRGAIRLLYQTHRGVAAARNCGVRAAHGRYLAFLDSDDLWLPDKLAMQIAFMERHPDARISQTEEIWVRRGVRVNPKNRHRKPSGDIFERSLDLCLVSPSAVVMTRELFVKTGGFDESLPVCEDYDLWLRIAADVPVLLVPEALVIKRGGHADQLSRSIWGMDRYRIAALQKLLRSGLTGERRRWTLMALQRKVAIVAAGARKRGRESEAASYEALVHEILEEPEDGRATERLCQDARISPADHPALAELGTGR